MRITVPNLLVVCPDCIVAMVNDIPTRNLQSSKPRTRKWTVIKVVSATYTVKITA